MSIYNNESMVEVFIYETEQLLEQLESIAIDNEKSEEYSPDIINEIFRIMHTIKGSSAMMMFQNISKLTHSIEDVFFHIRENKPQNVDYSKLTDLILLTIDFISSEITKIKNTNSSDGDPFDLILLTENFLNEVKPPIEDKIYCYKATIYFEEDSEMENIRAFNVVNNLNGIAKDIKSIPADLDDPGACEVIKCEGFTVYFKSLYDYEDAYSFLSKTILLKDLTLVEHIQNSSKETREYLSNFQCIENSNKQTTHNVISVSVKKLDLLMDLVGELVISEAMVTQNPDLKGLTLNNFNKATRQHRKIINELQDIAMSIRMVPLSLTFHKMNRIVRDMSKKLSKSVKLNIIGEDTEVDKNIIEHISDPLIHLIRNSIDHGIETQKERKRLGKPEVGTITLEAKNDGGDVLIIVRDDGKGLDSKKILERAYENGIVSDMISDISEKEIYKYIFEPGFSTNSDVTEFSGRGVGMDVVSKSIGEIGGTVLVDSTQGISTTFTLKIPLTLAIIDGMIVKVGSSTYTIPTINIKEIFKAGDKEVITDPDGNEVMMVRDECLAVVNLDVFFGKQEQRSSKKSEGVIIVIENDGKKICIYADELVGQQQVVVKSLPAYIKKLNKLKGVTGCTLLGNGSISLILDISGLFDFKKGEAKYDR